MTKICDKISNVNRTDTKSNFFSRSVIFFYFYLELNTRTFVLVSVLEIDDVEGEPIRSVLWGRSGNRRGGGGGGNLVVLRDRDGGEREKSGAEGEEQDPTIHPSRRNVVVDAVIIERLFNLYFYSPFRGNEGIVIREMLQTLYDRMIE